MCRCAQTVLVHDDYCDWPDIRSCVPDSPVEILDLNGMHLVHCPLVGVNAHLDNITIDQQPSSSSVPAPTIFKRVRVGKFAKRASRRNRCVVIVNDDI